MHIEARTKVFEGFRTWPDNLQAIINVKEYPSPSRDSLLLPPSANFDGLGI